MPSFLRVILWHSPFLSTERSVMRFFRTWLLLPPWSMTHILPSVSTSFGAFFINARLPRLVLAFFRTMLTVDDGSAMCGSKLSMSMAALR